MKYMKKSAVLLLLSFGYQFAIAQDTLTTHSGRYSGDSYQLIPDKVTEIAIPLLAAFLFLTIIANVFKNRADHQLKLRMIEKGVSEESLVKIFKESNAIAKLQPLKWFLFSLALAISFITIHLLRDLLRNGSGYLPLGIIILFFSIASFIYYRILSKNN